MGTRAEALRPLAVALVVILGLLLGLPGRARADEEAEFQRHLDRALALYQDQRYEESLPELQAAQVLRDDPRLLLNLGHVHRHLGHGDEALRYYQLFLDRSPGLSEADRATVMDYMDKARALLPRPAARPVVPAAVPPARPPVAAPLAAALIARPVPRPVPKGPPEPPPVYRRWWFWGLMGLAAAGVVTIAVVSAQPWDSGIPSGVPLHDARF